MTPFAWTTAQVLEATHGRLLCGALGTTFAGIGIDSRTLPTDHLFVAIAGESHDGHDFLTAVLERGANGVVVAAAAADRLPMERIQANRVTCVAVHDTTDALGHLARFNRCRGRLEVVAVTGSNGKTSTRRLMAQVMATTTPTLSTQGNLNNHIGLPLTLLRLAPQHRAAVLELGMNHAGEITRLGGICEPDVAVITNVGPAHLEGLGSIENVARAKGELLHTLRPGGTAILNADDARVAALADDLDCRVIFFGCTERAQVRADDIRPTDGGLAFDLTVPSGCIPVDLATPARVMVSNALAAAAAGHALGVPVEQIKAGLETFKPRSGRMGIVRPGRHLQLVDDSYNANPASMVAAIDTLADLQGDGRRLAVLGDMLELGPRSSDLHRDVGRAVGRAGIDRLYVTGQFATAVVEGAMDAHMPAAAIISGSKAELIDRLNTDLQDGDVILVKGSRGMTMEEVVTAIRQWARRANGQDRRVTRKSHHETDQ